VRFSALLRVRLHAPDEDAKAALESEHGTEPAGHALTTTDANLRSKEHANELAIH